MDTRVHYLITHAIRPKLFNDRNFFHLYRGIRSISWTGWCRLDSSDGLHSLYYTTKYGMFGGAGCKPIQVRIVYGVDEELGTTAVGLSRIGHGQRAWLVGESGVFRMFVLDPAMWGATLPCTRAAGIFAIGAAELAHKALDYSVKMESVVESVFCEIDKILGGDWHFVEIELDGEFAKGSLTYCRWVSHFVSSFSVNGSNLSDIIFLYQSDENIDRVQIG